MTTRRHPIRFAAVGLAMSGLMALAACGGDDDGGDDRATTTVEAADSGSDATTSDTDAADDAGDEGTDTTVDVSDVDALSADECRELAEDFQNLGIDPTSDGLEDLDEAFGALEDAVPDDLKDDVRTMREGLSVAQEASEKYKDDPTNPEYLEALQSIATPEYTQASARVAEYFSNCDDAVSGD